jgi:hypothetical protein
MLCHSAHVQGIEACNEFDNCRDAPGSISFPADAHLSGIASKSQVHLQVESDSG